MSSSKNADLGTDVGIPLRAASSAWCCSPLEFLGVRPFGPPARQELPEATRLRCAPASIPQFLPHVREASTSGLSNSLFRKDTDSRAADWTDAGSILTQCLVSASSQNGQLQRQKCRRPLPHRAQPTMWCTWFVYSCWAEEVHLRAHTHSSADAVGLRRRSISQGVKSLNDTRMRPQFGCLAQSTQAPSNSTPKPTFKIARQPDDLCEASKTSASGLSKLTDVAVTFTACRPNPTKSKQVHGECESYADILRDNMPVEHETTRRYFHHRRNLKDRHEDLGHKQLLVTRRWGTAIICNSVTSKFNQRPDMTQKWRQWQQAVQVGAHKTAVRLHFSCNRRMNEPEANLETRRKLRRPRRTSPRCPTW